MDKGPGAANDTQALSIDDFTAALELDFITSNFVNNQQLDITSFGTGQDETSQNFQGIGSLEPLSVLGVESSHQQDAFAIGPAPTALGSQHVSMDFVERQPVNNANQFDEPGVFMFSEALGDGEPMGHLFGDEGNIIPSLQPSDTTTPPKIGTRFSSKSLRILKTWLANNNHHPYPTTEDMEILQRQTGLSRQQITNWLANTRRRTRFKVPPKRPPSPAITSSRTMPIDIPAGSSLSDTFQHLNPLQRWQVSPPEHEPASVSAIANAVSGFSSEGEDLGDRSLTDTIPTRSLYGQSSASSAGTSHSSRSSANSAYSHNSHTSLRSLEPLGKSAVKRRRRRALAKRPEAKGTGTLWQTSNTYQCTFCTETFKTKHNWQRHEKSLHLSLERWECAPTGATVPDAIGQPVCIFCSEANPNKEHLEKHNYQACRDRQPEDRTFYRKDHLQQHLKLVHDAKFLRWPMGDWKYESEIIRSRCGFCGHTMSSWTDRIDHLAEHFKDGKTMADWHGDWGFDDNVLNMVENSVQPYLIHMERNSPWPFTTKQGVPETPPNAYELIKLELEHFSAEHQNTKDEMPTNAELLYESCCVIFGCDSISFSKRPATSTQSWLRDLLMSSESIVQQARVRPMKNNARSRFTYLSINGKACIFEACGLEEQLQSYVEISKLIEPQISDDELQREACNIVERIEASSLNPSEFFTNFLFSLINGSPHWLAAFRHRTGLSPSEASNAVPPSSVSEGLLGSIAAEAGLEFSGANLSSGSTPDPTQVNASGGKTGDISKVYSTSSFFVNDDNCYRKLMKELTRFVTITTSPRNPNRRIPTDAELQHQARWISFEDDDPWNQTPADNPDWLRDFKREMGILDDDPGLSPS
ncbi:homeobox and C2H2 transcription factor [Colletotrichum paranaense]|uniref:Homeobox and C2H2 transcription factor n=1 Tax=Colletotrichum paranaense TaxID=1914294 RepID=A0ABQ9S6B6_9PEZI|nr:homeobox and C2H2 transcription factor [Colletotrichum paranaense]KAK1527822.1 homeobox and C2H2 transcription factor [Colletotrichum paranaense]